MSNTNLRSTNFFAKGLCLPASASTVQSASPVEARNRSRTCAPIASIAAYMKLAYKTWNREHYVSDEVIKTDLAALSGGLIVLPEEQNLSGL